MSAKLGTGLSRLIEKRYPKHDAQQPDAAEIDTMNQHVIVVGYGRVGQEVVAALDKQNVATIVVDSDPTAVKLGAGKLPIFVGNISQHELLHKLAPERAQVVVLTINARLASPSAQDFIREILCEGLQVRYVLVGDDFRFGARRAGDYAMLDAAGNELGFDVARMNSYEVHGLRVSSSAVREALGQGQMALAASLLGRPYAISGHVVHGRKLGRELGASQAGASDGFRTLNLRFDHARAAASGIFVVQVHGLAAQPLAGVANLGVRPSLSPDDVNGGRVLLETHVLDWPASLGAEGAYGKIIRVDLLHKLHDELKYDGLEALTAGIAKDCSDARAWFASRHGQTHRQTTRDRI